MTLLYYESLFSGLNLHTAGGFASPHKVAMPLAVTDLIEDETLAENRIEYSGASAQHTSTRTAQRPESSPKHVDRCRAIASRKRPLPMRGNALDAVHEDSTESCRENENLHREGGARTAYRRGRGPVTGAVWDGWWVVRWGPRLVHIEADGAEDAVQGSIEALRGLGDWTEDPDELRAFVYTELGKHGGPRDFTRAVIDRERRGRPRPPGRQRRSLQRPGR